MEVSRLARSHMIRHVDALWHSSQLSHSYHHVLNEMELFTSYEEQEVGMRLKVEGRRQHEQTAAISARACARAPQLFALAMGIASRLSTSFHLLSPFFTLLHLLNSSPLHLSDFPTPRLYDTTTASSYASLSLLHKPLSLCQLALRHVKKHLLV